MPCLSKLLYSSESWTLYRHHLKALEASHIKCLQGILGIRWWHKVPHTEIGQRSHVQYVGMAGLVMLSD